MTTKQAEKAIEMIKQELDKYSTVRRQDPSAVGKERTANYAAEYTEWRKAVSAAKAELVAFLDGNMTRTKPNEWHLMQTKNLAVGRVNMFSDGGFMFYDAANVAEHRKAATERASIARAVAHEECWNRR